MKTKSKITNYILHGFGAAVLLLTAQISLGSSATWLLSPQDSAWENADNWTPGEPPNGPSDIATFAHSSQQSVGISTSVEVNSIEFRSDAASFTLWIPQPSCGWGCAGSELVISGTGVINNNSVLQRFDVGGLAEGGRLIFNDAATAATGQMHIANAAALLTFSSTPGETIFNDTSSAAGASIDNGGSSSGLRSGHTIFNDASTADHASMTNGGGQPQHGGGDGGYTSFNDTSTAGHATITNEGGEHAGGRTIFNDSSTADSAILVANGADIYGQGGAVFFSRASTGGTAQVKVLDLGYLDISGHNGGVTIGSIEGSGNVYLGANRLTVGRNNINTSFSGVISGNGSLAKVGSGILTLQANHCIADTVGLILVSGSTIKLDFTGPPDVIASLKVNGVPQPPGIYGSPTSGAPNILLEFRGTGRVSVGPLSTLGNISTRAFVQTGDNVMIGGFIVQGAEPKRVVIRAIGPELNRFGVPNALANPRLELHDSEGVLIASNDNWVTTIIGGVITANQARDILDSGYVPRDPRESAIIADLPAGNYTAIVRGVSNSTGVALVEVYDLSPDTHSLLGNISTRSFVETGDDVMIGGFIVAGAQPKRVIVRAIGPELTQYGVPDVLADPTLELHDHAGTLIASNDNWLQTIIGGIITSNQVDDIRNSDHAPRHPRESAIIATLQPGNYTAIVRGVNNTAGVGLVEVYVLY